MREYGIWKFSYQDNYYDFKSYANTENKYVLADFYIKYPFTAIEYQFQNPSKFISLSQVS
jgi:hypothetical protein